ncbi:GH39 family glycosyl hydrolase [Tengunoibacter tsumagoiensis]|uniref:Beta-xylosidase n=1 Tax=Tengunoibacter tsumagoiensis TaxID=2014871 RepID=A0A402AAI3_9CHLR|nr:beta-xylosidase [Tengunoibacter tsumagoiensis]GCE16108.1 beta-xylosidase [Tengunoibacter tsumagoiensis]
MDSQFSFSAQARGSALFHYWETCVGAGRANEGLRANWLEQLQLATQECGFRYIRFHGLFHDDMFVLSKRENHYHYNWQYIDELFDRLLKIGIRPIVEFAFMPTALASGEQTIFWWKGNVTPPADYNQWAQLIQQVTEHWITRYGLDEVRNWYFEVWNEPNLSVFWSGTQAEYFELYRVTATILKGIDARLRVGGPATSNYLPKGDTISRPAGKYGKYTELELRNDTVEWEAVWIKDFLTFCEEHELPVDFVSTHPYPTDLAIDLAGEAQAFTRNNSATVRDLTHINKIVRESAYPTAEIHLTEWNSSPSPRDFAHDYLPAAAFVARANIEASGLVTSLSYWTFTDVFEENGGGHSIFHGGFGMINFQGIVKPTFHAYRFLHLLGDEELYRGEGGIFTRHSQNNAISGLLYHYPTELTTAIPTAETPADAERILRIGCTRTVHLELTDLMPGTPFLIEIVDEHHGFAYHIWQELGCPEHPTREQIAELKAGAWNTKKIYVSADEQGNLSLDLSLEPWSLASIRTY